MTFKNTKTVLFASLIVAMILPFSMMDEAEASCWWCSSSDETQQLYFQLGYQHECDKGWGKCVTMSGHWQPIQEGKSENLGFKVKNDYDWVKPIIQTKTKEISVRGVWDVHSTVVDQNNNSMGGADKKAVSKQYYYQSPTTESFNKVIADIDEGSLIFQVITVRSIT